MSEQVIYYILGITGGLFALIVVAYLIIKSKVNKSDMKKIRQLREGTKQNKYSMDVIYQKLYNFYTWKLYICKMSIKQDYKLQTLLQKHYVLLFQLL